MDAPTAATLDPIRQYRSWASVFFALLAAVGLVGLAVVIPSMWAPRSLLLVATVGVGVAILVAVSLAIGRGDAWAIHAIAPMSLIVIVYGLVRTAVAFGSGTITIPLEVVGALAVLSRDHRPELLPPLDDRGRRRMWLAVGGLVVTSLLPFVGEPALRGNLLTAGEDDLSLMVQVDCARASEPGSPVVATVEWSWAGGRPFAPATDGLVIRWHATTTGANPEAGLTLLAHRASDDQAIGLGSSGEVDALLEGFRRAGLPFAEFLIGRSGAELRDGRVEIDLVPSDRASRGGSVEVDAAYAHGDLWVRRSNLGACTW